ncbi:MAG: acyl carrier protein [Acidobacteriia bacterium]|nr:acyl carrier protein [Terriglobia bacterium]
MPENLIARLIGCVASTQHIAAEGIRAESTFEELGIDSLDGINILFALENEFKIQIPDNAAQHAKTIGDLAEGVRALILAQHPGSGTEAGNGASA